MLQLAYGLGLNLPDALPRNAELLADFLKRVIGIHADPKAQAKHPFLAGSKGGQHTRRGFAQVGLDRRVDRQYSIAILDEVTEVTVFLVTDRRFQADRLLDDLQPLSHLLDRHRQDRRHRAYAYRHSFLHVLAAIANGAHCVGKRERSGGDVCRILSQAVPGDI